MNVDNVIKYLDRFKKEHPEQIFIVETPYGTVEFKIGDALIYDAPDGCIVIDSE